jgi:hypothetical protein
LTWRRAGFDKPELLKQLGRPRLGLRPLEAQQPGDQKVAVPVRGEFFVYVTNNPPHRRG